MKRFWTVCVALVVCCSALPAQDRGAVQNRVSLGFGVSNLGSGNVAAAFGLSYGLDLKLTDSWSVMPAIGVEGYSESLTHIGMDGGDYHDVSVLDLVINARYRLQTADCPLTLSVGPYVSRFLKGDTYYCDWYPAEPYNGKEVFNNWDFGVKPALEYEIAGWFSVALESKIGLANVMRQYPEYNKTGSRHIFAVKAAAIFKF